MILEDFKSRLHEFFSLNPGDITINIPSGSGIASIAPVPASDWISGFASPDARRWNLDGQPTKYFGTDFRMCGAEFFGANTGKLDNYVCEQWRTTNQILALDVSKFPADIRSGLYEDKGKAPEKWIKPHALLNVASEYPAYSGFKNVYAPSASGMELGFGGYVLATNPATQPLQLIGTGQFCSMIASK
jgi:hypothetical protein